MTEARIIHESEAQAWRLLSYIFHCTVRPFSDKNLTRAENNTWKDLQAMGAVEYGTDFGRGPDQWRITPLGRELYYQLRACQVPDCPFLEVRGSSEGAFVMGRFVCPAHATKIGAEIAAFHFGKETIAPPPTLEELARERNQAAQKVKDWMNAEGAAGNLRFNDQAPDWLSYQAAQERLNAALAAVK